VPPDAATTSTPCSARSTTCCPTMPRAGSSPEPQRSGCALILTKDMEEACAIQQPHRARASGVCSTDPHRWGAAAATPARSSWGGPTPPAWATCRAPTTSSHQRHGTLLVPRWAVYDFKAQQRR
jgi:hypothetical protein